MHTRCGSTLPRIGAWATVIPDLDIYRSAQVLIKRHGQDAPIHAALRADELLEAGDLEGCAVFKRVLRAVEELEAVEPGAGDASQ